jgi:hypothetical protein
MIESWLSDYVIQQPSEYFVEKEVLDTDIFCNVLTEIEFFIDTL